MQLTTQFYLFDTFAWMNFSFIEIGSECFGLLTNICCCLLSNLQKLQLRIQEQKNINLNSTFFAFKCYIIITLYNVILPWSFTTISIAFHVQ